MRFRTLVLLVIASQFAFAVRVAAGEIKISGILSDQGWTVLEAIITVKGKTKRHELAKGSYGSFSKTIPYDNTVWLPVDVSLVELEVSQYNNNEDKRKKGKTGDGDVWWDCINFKVVNLHYRNTATDKWQDFGNKVDNQPGYMVPDPGRAVDKYGYPCAKAAEKLRTVYPKSLTP